MVLSETLAPLEPCGLLLCQVMPGGIQLDFVLRCSSLLSRYSRDTTACDPAPEPFINLRLFSRWRSLLSVKAVLVSSLCYAACFMILPASKLSPLFHTANTNAANFLATLRRAISGRIPFCKSPS